jgi:drug/metabolite transporter (DMT)-like permease
LQSGVVPRGDTKTAPDQKRKILCRGGGPRRARLVSTAQALPMHNHRMNRTGRPGRPSAPIARGVGLACLAALLFGVTAPFLKLASQGVGVFASASLLYLGASLSAGLLLLSRRERPPARKILRGGALSRLTLVALFGAVCAPALLVAGLARTDGATGSLILILEAPFTVLLARLFFREHLGRRILAAVVLVTLGAVILGTGVPAGGSVAGVALVSAAALAWALDNLLSRTLADADPGLIVALKGGFGGSAAAVAALVVGEAMPSAGHVAALLGIGAVGYGVSLGFYLRAQTIVGAARTASVFATAPFIGAVVALLMGAAALTWQLPVAAILMLGGLALHALERHAHAHTHKPVAHEHLHAHDDGHHTHHHDPMPVGPHSHRHAHDLVTHQHEHSEDIHHRHSH